MENQFVVGLQLEPHIISTKEHPIPSSFLFTKNSLKMIFAGYIALCTGYIRFDTFHIAGYIALCTEYIRFDTFHIVLCTRYIAFDTFHIVGYITLCTGYMRDI
ncbi:hypothetical protein H5410_039359 [Solanum commersonii]|uniref:Uncharacterized protein n=1 Tax=Solanum commersonii TaxID=4109 RepID=A0A9J5YE52_SOLCO|nr:hypothetical protein H5410_039359 [Solanum commersonii]